MDDTQCSLVDYFAKEKDIRMWTQHFRIKRTGVQRASVRQCKTAEPLHWPVMIYRRKYTGSRDRSHRTALLPNDLCMRPAIGDP